MSSMEDSGRSFHVFDLYPSDNTNPQSTSADKEKLFIFRILVSINIILNYDSGVIPASLLQIQDEISLSFTEKAALGSLVYLGLSVATLFVSPIFQRFPANKTLIVMLSLNCAFCLLFSFAYSLGVMYLGRLGMGFTQAFSVIYAPVWINEFSPKQKETRWMGLLQASVPIGVVLGYSVASFINISHIMTWRFAIQLQAVMELPLIVWLAHINKEDIEIIDHSLETIQFAECREQLRMLFTNKIYLMVTLALCSVYFVVAGVQYWITIYMIKVLMIHPAVAVLAFIVVSVTAPVCGGYKGSNIIPALKFCLIAGVLAALCSLPVAIARTGFTEFVSLWLLLFFGGAVIPCATGISVDAVQREYQSNATSFAQLCFNLLGFFLAPIVSAEVMERYEVYEVGLTWGFRFVLSVGWIGCVFMMIAYLLAKRTYVNPIIG